MKLGIISFTENGSRLSEKIAEVINGTDVADLLRQEEIELFTKHMAFITDTKKQNIAFVEKSVGEWAKEQFEKRNAMLFVGACGIAVRAVAPHLTDKLHDSPVLVMDEKGKYVIPIVAGHVGGANELAGFLAEKMGAEAVITTATDINKKFAVDLFAKKNELSIVNKEGIAKVSSKALSGQTITLSIESGHYDENGKLPEGIRTIAYPSLQKVDVLVASEKKEFDVELLLEPKEYVIGMGCKKGKSAEKIEAFIRKRLEEAEISLNQIAGLASIDIKKKEPGLLAWCRKENIPFITYTAEALNGVKGDFQKSDFVKDTVGVDNVCERAALKMCEPKGKLVCQKYAEDGMTIAIAKKEWKVCFDEA